MRWSIFLALFLAELGDKTQLAVLAFAAETGSRWSVFFAASLALVASTGLAVLVGDGLSRVVRPGVLQLAAGLLFVAIGLFVTWRAWSQLT